MADSPRIEDLKRRVQKDPASIAFAQLGEEYRRAGRSHEAIETCRAGLEYHPGYLSARVTLGRALFEIGELEEAEHELKEVLHVAPENLAALRALGETLRQRGDSAASLAHYEIALALAPRDADLQHTVAMLRAAVQREGPIRNAPPTPPAARPASAGAPLAPPNATYVEAETSPAAGESELPQGTVTNSAGAALVPSVGPPPGESNVSPAAPSDGDRQHAIAALEEWLAQIVTDRDRRSPGNRA